MIFEAFSLADYRFKNIFLGFVKSTSQYQQQHPKIKGTGKFSPLYFNGLELCFSYNKSTGCSCCMLDEIHCVDDRNFKRVHGCTWLQIGIKPCGLPHKKLINEQVILC